MGGTAFVGANRLSGGSLEWLTGWRWRWFGWARYVGELAPDADVWHGHDLTSLPAVIELKRRRGGFAVYDTHEVYLESGRHAGQAGWAKARLARLERTLAAEADAVITVNDSLATIVRRRLRVADVRVVYNCPPRYMPSGNRSRLREALALSPQVPLAIYHGSLAEHRGVEQLVEAMQRPEMSDVHVVFLGRGALRNWLLERQADPRMGGRLHVLDAVPPSQLLDWLVGIDVAVAPIQPSTLNHYYSSPNKVFEALAVGSPIAGSDFPEFRRVVADTEGGPLGELFDPTQPAQIAAAVRRILDLAPDDRARLRARCRQAATSRWNWEQESAQLLAVYDHLASRVVAAARAP